MKRTYMLIAALVMGLAFNATAQEQQSTTAKGYIGITGGLSPVFGNYTKSDYTSDASGYASTGANIGITGVYFIKHNFGVAALISYQGFGFHGSQSLADGFKEAFDLDSTTVYRKGNNSTFNFMIGPYYALPFAHKWHLDFRVLAGVVNAKLAGYEVFLEDGEGNQFSQKQSTATTFGYQAGVGLRYDIGRHLGVGVNADFFGSRPNFKIENDNRVNSAGRLLTNYKQSITGVNTNLTVMYRF
ncbi:outer membrane beta-barrel protein [Taibaiella koreensis]|uniref:outer membrane beta-barrel protein n=1 Tax=Taibaiella koreensis TaxID=1268548 RepID=UPI000E5994A8|nr:outer membrane beta-barrel protein [Taibaiella koreensis]